MPLSPSVLAGKLGCGARSFAMLLLVTLSLRASTLAQTEIPPALVPFEHLVGAWKGVGIPTANKLKGWQERHTWAWAFHKGRPVALSFELEGSKLMAKGRLAFDPKAKLYRLEALDVSGNTVLFLGAIDKARQVLTLDRQGPLPGGSLQKLTLRLNSNKIRYTVWDDQRQKGAPRFSRITESQMGKEGEAFAAGSTTSNTPKCIITGGAATMTVSFGGKAYPVCCTGCRDEFEVDPEKYIKRLAARDDKSATPTPSKASDEDPGFERLLDGSRGAPSRPDAKD
jgi:YHS domain-containing protein